MFAEEIRRAVQACQRGRLPELSAAVWKGFAAGAVSENEAQRLAEEIEARKGLIQIGETARRSVGSRPRSSASLERRRSWAAGSWMPPAMAAGFTQAENAALAVIIREIAATGSCELPAAAIAGRAGISTSSARNAVREARRRGVLHVVERRIAYDRNQPNLITIASRELALWIRTRSRVDRSGGGVKSVTPTPNHLIFNPARPAAAAWKAGTFGEAGRKVWANRTKFEPPQGPSHAEADHRRVYLGGDPSRSMDGRHGHLLLSAP